MRTVDIAGIQVGAERLVLIAGPCVIEDEERTVEIARSVREICSKLDTPFIFKASFDKANRTSGRSFRGPGIEAGLEILAKVKRDVKCPVLSDIHEPAQADRAGKVLDVIQIPAFLCRQTDLLAAAARTGKAVNIKKAQFLAPWDMENAIDKVEAMGNRRILLTERGTSFGYNNLVSGMRSLPILRSFGYPVVYDGTHSVQLPGGQGTASGGQRDMVPPLVRAAVAAGIDALFLEVHPEPEKALSDAATTLRLDDLPQLLAVAKQIHSVVRVRGLERSAMKTALISDIHANLEALQAVMQHVESQHVDRVFCLGDVVNYGPDPEECLHIIRRVDLCLKGNHEEAVLLEPIGFNPVAATAAQWTRARLEPGFLSAGAKSANWNFMKALPLTHTEGDALFVHASPREPTTEYLLPSDVDPLLGGMTEKLAENFALVQHLCFVGHTHLPGVFRESGGFFTPDQLEGEFTAPAGEKAIVNVGSVGQPRDRNPKACYVTFDGELIRYHRVEYDVHSTCRKVLKAKGLPDWCGTRLVKGE